MRVAIYPGTFDPVTNGHLDIVERAAMLFDQVIVAVTTNSTKNPMFSIAERLDMFQEVTQHLSNVQIESFSGLLVEYAARRGASVLIRGLRAISDFEYESQMALINRKISHGMDTVFLTASEKNTYLNSTIVKEVARFGGDVTCFVPAAVNERIRKKLAKP